MKLKSLFFLGAIIFLLTACNSAGNEEESMSGESIGFASENSSEQNSKNSEGENLIDKENLNEGGWINFEGNVKEQKEMVHTVSIPYDPSTNYELNIGAYVTYLKGEEFIKTVLTQDDLPRNITKVEEADNIQLSFHKDFIESIELTKK